MRPSSDSESPIAKENSEQYPGRKAEYECDPEENIAVRADVMCGRKQNAREHDAADDARAPAGVQPRQEPDGQVQKNQAEEQFFVDAGPKVAGDLPQRAFEVQAGGSRNRMKNKVFDLPEKP